MKLLVPFGDGGLPPTPEPTFIFLGGGGPPDGAPG